MEELLITVGYIVIFAIIAGILASKLKLPSVIGLLLVGSIVGPKALGIISNADLIQGAADLGAILLLFLIGIEFSISKLFKTGFRALVITILKIGIVFFFGYEIALILGFDQMVGLFIGIILSISSTAIFIKMSEDKKIELWEKESSLLISILVFEDIFAIFALTFISSLGEAGQITVGVLLKNFAIAMIIIALSYFLLLNVFTKWINWLIKNTTEDTFAFIAIGICIGFSLLAAAVKLSPSVGAFLAGSLVASCPGAKKFQETVHPLSLTFVALFFLSLGMLVDFSQVFRHFFLIIILLVINLVSKFLSIAIGTYFFARFRSKEAIFSGLVLTSVGEFSLLIAAEGQGIIPGIDFISIISAVIFFSAIIMSILVGYTDKIEYKIDRWSNYQLKNKIKDIAGRISNVPTAFEDGGNLYTLFRGKSKSILIQFIIVMTELGLVFLLWKIFREFIINIIGHPTLKFFLIAILVLAIAVPLAFLLKNIVVLLDLLVNSFIETEYYQQIQNKLTKRIGYYLVVGIGFVLVGLLLPLIFSLIRLPKVFNVVSPLFIFIGVLFIWGTLRKVKRRVETAVVTLKKKVWK